MLEMPAFVRRQSNRKSYDFESYYGANSAADEPLPKRTISFSKRLSMTLSPKETDIMPTEPVIVTTEEVPSDISMTPTTPAAESDNIDVQAAIQLLQRLRETATQDELVALHRALLPLKTDAGKHQQTSASGPGYFRRSATLPPGLATRRRSQLQGSPRKRAHQTKARALTVTTGQSDNVDGPEPSPAQTQICFTSPSSGRPSSPNQLNILALGGHRLGTLRITNGAASPEPTKLSHGTGAAWAPPSVASGATTRPDMPTRLPPPVPMDHKERPHSNANSIEALIYKIPGLDLYDDSSEDGLNESDASPAPAIKRHTIRNRRLSDSSQYSVDESSLSTEGAETDLEARIEHQNEALRLLSGETSLSATVLASAYVDDLGLDLDLLRPGKQRLETIYSASSVASFDAASASINIEQGALDDVPEDAVLPGEPAALESQARADSLILAPLSSAGVDEHSVTTAKPRNRLHKRPPLSRNKSRSTRVTASHQDPPAALMAIDAPAANAAKGLKHVSSINKALPTPNASDYSHHLADAASTTGLTSLATVPAIPMAVSANFSRRMSQGSDRVLAVRPDDVSGTRQVVQSRKSTAHESGARAAEHATIADASEPKSAGAAAVKFSSQPAKKPEIEKRRSFFGLGGRFRSKSTRKFSVEAVVQAPAAIEEPTIAELSAVNEIENKPPEEVYKATIMNPDEPLLDAATATIIPSSDSSSHARSKSVPRAAKGESRRPHVSDRADSAVSVSHRPRPKSMAITSTSIPMITINDGNDPDALVPDAQLTSTALPRRPSSIARKPLPSRPRRDDAAATKRISRAIPWETDLPPSPPLRREDAFYKSSTVSPKSGSGSDLSALQTSNDPATPPDISRSSSTHNLLDRYSGGLEYGWERGSGFSGSAGTRSAESEAAKRKSMATREAYGIDLSDVPLMLQRIA